MSRTTTILTSALALFAAAAAVAHAGRNDGALVNDAACGDANGDRRLDIGDAIYTLRHLFSGGPAPVCRPCQPADPLTQRLRDLEEMVAQRGDPAYVLGEAALAIRTDVDPVFFLADGIVIDPTGEQALVPTGDGSLRRVEVVWVNDAVSLLDLALIEVDGGDPVEIKYKSSACTLPVACDAACHAAGLFWFASDAPIGAPMRCQRVNNERSTCTDKLVPICHRVLYFDAACTNRRTDFDIEGWRCN